MTEPWNTAGFPPLADRAFDLDLDEESFSFLGHALERHGDLFGVAPVSRRAGMVVINRPDEAWHVLGRNHTNYTKGVGTRKVRMLLGKGLIANEGKAWRDRRRVLQPSFHQEAVAGLAKVMVDVNRAMLEKWCALAASGEPIDVSTDTARLTLEIVVRCLFGDDLEELAAATGDIPFAVLTDDLNRTLTTVHRLQEDRGRIRELIARRRSRDAQPRDLLGVLLAARDANGEPIDDRSVTDEVVTLAVAGHETSASVLSWAWYLLAQHPEVEASLHREVDAFPSPGPRTAADLSALPYARRVLDETLRLDPPGWILTRRAIEADRIGPYAIPAGTDVLVSPFFLHRNSKLWPSADVFDPDRFTGKPPHKHAYIPFGAGPRRCIGDIFGIVEMHLHLALVARRLSLRYLGEKPPSIEARVNLRPKERLLFRGEPRS